MAERQSLGPVFITQPHIADINEALRVLAERIDVLYGLRGAVTIRDRVAVSDPTADDDAVTLGTLTNTSTGYVRLSGTQTITGAKRFNGGFGVQVTAATQQSAIASLTDSSGGTANDTVQALTDPANGPVSADALRDDLVANLIPELRNNLADLAAKINAILPILRTFGFIAT